jgi:hypothetical protein
MLIYRLTEPARLGRYTIDGNLEYGSFFVDDEGLVRWVSEAEQLDLVGVDRYAGGRFGYNVYEIPDWEAPQG